MAEHARRVPGGKLLVDDLALRQIILEMRDAMEEEARARQQAAQQAAAERERILVDARNQARAMLDEAQVQVSSQLDDHNIVQQARERAKEVIAEAEKEADKMRAEANRYTTHQLSVLEVRIQRILAETQAGQAYLNQAINKNGASDGN